MRYFTLSEAEQLLPRVEKHLRDALFHKTEYQRADKTLEQTLRRVRVSGGARINPGEHLATRAERDNHLRTLQGSLEAIQADGVLIKDLDTGLLDFMTRYQDQDVCLCWRLGETGIHFWHSETEGFPGRKPIDQAFLDGHHTGTKGEGSDRTGPQ